MKVSLSWLKELVRIDVPIEKLVDALNLSGTKVEGVIAPSSSSIRGVVVAEALDISPHPNADNLTLVEVKTGADETQRIVCGAKNFGVGDRVPLAVVGAHLPDMDITERKIRGEVSHGMLCSAHELGISNDHTGILVLPPDAELGDDVVHVLGLDDTLIELEITPNRPDCMSMVGIAREVGALLGREVTFPETDVEGDADVSSEVSVEIWDGEGCPRYVARYVQGVQPAPSPGWMATRLLRAGIRPISNVVDITNYVMLELGQPLHAFDAAMIEERKIVIRRAQEEEHFRTLDGVDRTMSRDDLMIADPTKVLAIAGVMGGEHSEISPTTTEVIIEAAYFDPASVALTARRQLLRTESSARFERGMDPEAPPVAAARAARLMKELAGAKVAAEVVDEYPVPVVRRKVVVRADRVGALLGKDVAPDRQASLLRSIDLVVDDSNESLEVEIPGFRPDLAREVDLIEEIARLIGFEQLPSTLPPGRVGALEPHQRLERSIRGFLIGQGLFEAVTGSFASEEDLGILGLKGGSTVRPVAITNPMSDEEKVLRTTLLPGLLQSTAGNLAHHARGAALFEVSRIYERSEAELPHEPLMLGAVMSGIRSPHSWGNDERSWGFFEAKGILDSMFHAFGMDGVAYRPVSGMPFHPTRAARLVIDEKPVGVLGELHPRVCDHFDVLEGTVTLEIGFASIASMTPDRIQIDDLPRFPSIYIDLAVVVDEGVAAGEIEEVIRATGAPEVTSVRMFDLYRGDQVPDGKKSLAFALELRDPERTLTDADAGSVRDRVLAALAERTGAEIRS